VLQVNKSTELKKILFFVYSLFGFSALGQQGYWQQQVNYLIDVQLQVADCSLIGHAQIEYMNHSPDTLQYIWFNLWPNGYRNDRTSLSDQLLENGESAFYFSGKEQKGFINQLDFRIDGNVAKTEDHPQWQDVIKVILPKPLIPGQTITITTSFREKLSYIFSRSGYKENSYQVTQWYPRPAVYDNIGWHPMPNLDQAEFYEEFGNYEVRITLPKAFKIAASGELQNEDEKQWLIKLSAENRDFDEVNEKNAPRKHFTPAKTDHKSTFSPAETKTIIYKQNNIRDFSWFASPDFNVLHHSFPISSNKTIDVFLFYYQSEKKYWTNTIPQTKQVMDFYQHEFGTYPYPTLSLVEIRGDHRIRVCAPCISGILPGQFQTNADEAIRQAIGEQWFYGIIGPDGRKNPWLFASLTEYYNRRFKEALKAEKPPGNQIPGWIAKKFPSSPDDLIVHTLEEIKVDQPIATAGPDFTVYNYWLIPNLKGADWLKRMEDTIGRFALDNAIRSYFSKWSFKHPKPEDLQHELEQSAGRSLEISFMRLHEQGSLRDLPRQKKVKPTFIFSAKNPEAYHYINFAPAAGYNLYDQFMIGGIVHNFNLPPQSLQFIFAPLYATGSKQFNGIGLIQYSWYPRNNFSSIVLGIDGGRFSTMSGTDSLGHEIYGGFYKIAPSIRFSLKNKNPRSLVDNWIEWKTFLIGEKSFDYVYDQTDSLYFPTPQSYSFRYLNQLSLNIQDDRILYPYRALFQIQQSSDFYRIQVTGNYLFNYPHYGGLSIRFFAAGFGYIGGKTPFKEFETTRFQPKLTAVRGDEDYTYSNYFIGRTETSGFPSQQIMERDGALKLRTDLFQDLQGRSDQWVASLNFSTTLPEKLFPIRLPVKIFFDLGTYSAAWSNQPPTSRFLFVGGFQVSLIRNLVNIYVPLFYSEDFSNSLKTVPDENTFWKKISFSIDVQRFSLKKLLRIKPPY
jgi:hypothetical protein